MKYEKQSNKQLHICHHCGTPTTGTPAKYGIHFNMCPDCYNYIGSPAAQLPGATMKNRFEMERKIEEQRKEQKNHESNTQNAAHGKEPAVGDNRFAERLF